MLLFIQRTLLFVELVVARIGRQRAAIDLHDLGNDAVHEFAIMRGHQQGALVTLQEFLEPDQAFEIEMVAWFVEQHGIGPHEQDAGERDAHFPAAGQGADIAIHHLLAETEPVEHLARTSLQRITAKLLEPALHFPVALDDRLDFVEPVRVGHGGFEFAQFGRDGAHRASPVHDLGHRAAAGHFAHILAEIADGDAPIDADLALVGLFLAGDHPEQGRLASAIGAHKANLLAPQERRRGLDEENLVAVLLADVFKSNHGRGVPGNLKAMPCPYAICG